MKKMNPNSTPQYRPITEQQTFKHTNHSLNVGLHEASKSLVNPHSEIAQNLAIFAQVKIAETVFVLLRCVGCLECLFPAVLLETV